MHLNPNGETNPPTHMKFTSLLKRGPVTYSRASIYASAIV